MTLMGAVVTANLGLLPTHDQKMTTAQLQHSMLHMLTKQLGLCKISINAYYR